MKVNRGFTLIELMIAMVLGLLIVGVTLTVYLSTVRGSSETLKSARLNHDLESAMSLMVNDIRRAGYWGGAVPEADIFENPFTNQDVAGSAPIGNPSVSCFLYSYDFDADENVDTDEYYGFKLDGTTIRMRLTGTAGNGNTDCNDGNWAGELIDSDIVSINSLQFLPTSTCLNADITDDEIAAAGAGVSPVNQSNTVSCEVAAAGNALANSNDRIIERREVNIVLTGSLVDDANVTKTVNSTVIIRNDNLYRLP
ncbi:prepilin-type N-terminal cleavage/methylation domain-containing protein [Methylophaga sp.]|uniref:PilW family protein n=1 Tax=Methylophaga sp. TaxID=2024840 RepID=UPI0025CB87BA|nr:prepilin-type N-terminal cleavage/methylation domain-containing protein [Methylophaga sp.]